MKNILLVLIMVFLIGGGATGVVHQEQVKREAAEREDTEDMVTRREAELMAKDAADQARQEVRLEYAAEAKDKEKEEKKKKEKEKKEEEEKAAEEAEAEENPEEEVTEESEESEDFGEEAPPEEEMPDEEKPEDPEAE